MTDISILKNAVLERVQHAEAVFEVAKIRVELEGRRGYEAVKQAWSELSAAHFGMMELQFALKLEGEEFPMDLALRYERLQRSVDRLDMETLSLRA